MLTRKLYRLSTNTKFPFGKHKGKYVGNIIKEDLPYMKWLWHNNISPIDDALDRDITKAIEEEYINEYGATAELAKRFDSLINNELSGLSLHHIL